MHWNSILLGYIGPETIVPATSALAAVGGVLLLFGKTITRPIVAGAMALLGKKKEVPVPATSPAQEQSKFQTTNHK